MIRVACPHCHKKYALDDRFEGKRAKCKACDTVFLVAGEPELPPLPDLPEDEESFEVARPRKARRWLPIAAVCLTIVLVGSAGLFFALRNVRPELFPSLLSSPEDELLAFVPADAESLLLVDVEALKQIPEVQDLASRAMDVRKEKVSLGLGQRTLALSPRKASDKGSDSLTIFALAAPFNVQPLLDAGQAQRKEKDGFQHFEIPADGVWLAQPSPKIVIRANSEAKLLASLEAARKKTASSEDLRQAFRATSGPVRMATIGPAAQSVVPASPLAMLFKDDVDAPPLCLSQAISTSLHTDRIEARIVSRYSDAEKAKTAGEIQAKGIKKAIALMAGEKQGGEVYLMRVILDSLKIEPKGVELVLRLEVPLKELKRLK